MKNPKFNLPVEGSNRHHNLSQNSWSAPSIRTQTRSVRPVFLSVALRIDPAIPGTNRTGSRVGSIYSWGFLISFSHISIDFISSSNSIAIPPKVKLQILEIEEKSQREGKFSVWFNEIEWRNQMNFRANGNLGFFLFWIREGGGRWRRRAVELTESDQRISSIYIILLCSCWENYYFNLKGIGKVFTCFMIFKREDITNLPPIINFVSKLLINLKILSTWQIKLKYTFKLDTNY